MSYYIGLFTPSTTLAEMRSVDTAVKTLALAIADSQAPQSFRDEFKDFAQSWVDFYNSNDGIVARSTNAVYEKTLGFKEETRAYRDAFVAMGGKVVTPTLAEPKKSYGVLPYIIAGVAVIGLTYFVFERKAE